MKKNSLWIWVLLALPIARLLFVVYPRISYYTQPYYTEKIYKNLEDTFNRSQYRQKNPTALIPDETVFGYAAGAYLHGIDPILVNSEHTPLGKYFIAMSILLIKNDRFIVLPFSLLTLFSLWLLSVYVLQNKLLATIPVAVFGNERLFLDQVRFAPLLDIIQLPFILLALLFYLKEYKRNRYIGTACMLGLVMATKTIIPAILLLTCYTLVFLIKKNWIGFRNLFMWFPISIIIFVSSYLRTFMSGYTVSDFIGFQKWIFLYQQSKLIFPFSAWRLIFLNQWQTWWGDMRYLRVEDWNILWPISSGMIIVGVLFFMREIIRSEGYFVAIVWCVVYAAFLSIGVVSSRFFLPFLPVAYIVSTFVGRMLISKVWRSKQ